MAVQLTGREISEARRQILIADPGICHHCKSKGSTDNDRFCPNCGFPQLGSQTEMKRFIYNIRHKQDLLADHHKAVGKARKLLFGLSALFTLFAVVLGLVINDEKAVLITNLIVAAIYLALGFWSRSSAFPAILTGFLLYVTLIVINAVFDPTTILQGLLFKIFIIAAFVYGYKGVKEAERLEEELRSVKKARDLTLSDEVQ